MRAFQEIIRARRLRDRLFPADLFADPAWDMLLALMVSRQEGKRISVSGLCMGAAVPQATAHRWLGIMVERGLVVRVPDDMDARLVWVALTDETAGAMAEWVAASGQTVAA